MKIENNNNINFKINLRNVLDHKGKLQYRTNTWFFRPDLKWNEFCKFVGDRFENDKKVVILDLACSDGEETYSLAYKLIENLRNKAKKFFPINASDIDSENIKIANSKDKYRLDKEEALFINELKYPFFAYFKIDYNDKNIPTHLKPNQRLKNKVRFKQNDALSEIKNMQNNTSIVFLKNCWPYINGSERNKILSELYKKFDDKSLIVIGAFDRYNLPMKFLMAKNGFEETEIKNVFQKTKKTLRKTILIYIKELLLLDT